MPQREKKDIRAEILEVVLLKADKIRKKFDLGGNLFPRPTQAF